MDFASRAGPSSSGSRGSAAVVRLFVDGRLSATVCGRASVIEGNASSSASANSIAVGNRSAGSSASARANVARSADKSPPSIAVKLSTARAPVPLTRRAQSNSCISAARLNTSARRSHSPPAERSGAV